MASINDLAAAAISSSAGTRIPAVGGDVVAAAASTVEAQQQPTPANGSSAESHPVRGSLVVLEGLDRSGKTTQVKLLQTRFVEAGKKVKVMRFPDRTTPTGQLINAYLTSQSIMSDHVIHLLFSANRWEAVSTITALLAAGTTVLCDRYYYSGVVYSAAKHNPELSLQWARAPEVGLPRPDLVLFLDLDEEEAKKRGGFGGEVYEKAEMQRRVKELFRGLSMGRVLGASEEGSGPGPAGVAAPRGMRFRQEEEDLHIVDASSSVEDVAEEIWRVVRPRVEAVERGEVGHVVRKVL